MSASSSSEDLVVESATEACEMAEEATPADVTVVMEDGAKEAEGWVGAGAGRPKEEPVLSLVSLNSKAAPSFDLVRGSMAVMSELPNSVSSSARMVRVSCGREPSNTIVLADSRVSSVHFSLRVKAARGGLVTLELLDQSSNGTWVNGRKVGKGRRVPLGVGDKLVVLPASQVGQEAEVGFLLLHDVRGARCASGRSLGETAALTLTPDDFNNNPPLSRVLEPELECHICAQALYSCLTVVPCGHNFCAPCLLKWRKNSPNCPECRTPIQQAVRNLSVDKVVETFRQAHPEAARSDAELRSLDALDQDPEYRAMLRWILKEGPWADVQAVPTPQRRRPQEGPRATGVSNAQRLNNRQRARIQQDQAGRNGGSSDDNISSAVCVIC